MKKLISIGYVERSSHLVDLPVSDLAKVVYAPNEQTGFPMNDQSFMKQAKTDPRLIEALDAQNRPISVNSPSHDDDDVVLDTLQLRGETDEEYSERMDKYVDTLRNKDSKD